MNASIAERLVYGQLRPTSTQKECLLETLSVFQKVTMEAMRVGQSVGTTGNARIHAEAYDDLRTQFGLSANLTVRAIARAAYYLKEELTPKTAQPESIDYDRRVFSVNEGASKVSLSTNKGRLKGLSLDMSEADRSRLKTARPTRALTIRPRQTFWICFFLMGPVRAQDLATAEAVAHERASAEEP